MGFIEPLPEYMNGSGNNDDNRGPWPLYIYNTGIRYD